MSIQEPINDKNQGFEVLIIQYRSTMKRTKTVDEIMKPFENDLAEKRRF